MSKILMLLIVTAFATPTVADQAVESSVASSTSYFAQIGTNIDTDFLFTFGLQTSSIDRYALQYSYRKSVLSNERLAASEGLFANYARFLSPSFFLCGGVYSRHQLRNVFQTFGGNPLTGQVYRDWGTLEQFDAGFALGIGQEWRWSKFVLNVEYFRFARQLWLSKPTLTDMPSLSSQEAAEFKKTDPLSNSHFFSLGVSLGIVI